MFNPLTTLSPTFAITLALNSPGCAPTPTETKIDPAAWAAPQAVPVVHSTSVAVTEGGLPLVYAATEACTVRIIDQSSGKQVAVATALPGQILAINAKGARMGGALVSDPLLADHRYTVFVDIRRSEAGPAIAGPGKN